MTEIEGIEHKIEIHEISLFRQVIENKANRLDVIREAISNVCAKEVGATTLEINIFDDPDYGISLRFKDDGCGMDYTGPPQNAGRLDRFLNLGFSGAAGIRVDEYSWKGLGSKLMYDSRKLEIETWDGKEKVYRVVVNEPKYHLTKDAPELPKPIIYSRAANPNDKRGTIINVYGYEGGRGSDEYLFDNVKEYLLYRTLVGCTKDKELPKVVLKIGDQKEDFKPGYQWLDQQTLPDGTIDPRTAIIASSIKEERTIRVGDKDIVVSVVLKGGFTLDTGKFDYMVPHSFRVGAKLSVNGIPYLELDINRFKGKADKLLKNLTDIVIECDSINLDMSRNNYVHDTIGETFEDCVKWAFERLSSRDEYKRFKDAYEQAKTRKLSSALDERKSDLEDPKQRWTFVDGAIIHREPRCEHDTLAVLWKLEGMKKLPFAHFQTLEHTEQEGMDLIVDIKENDGEELKKYVSMEVEYLFENFLRHKHRVKQTAYIICWDIRKPDVCLSTSLNYKFIYREGDHQITVYVIRKMLHIAVGRKQEIHSGG